MIVYGYNLEKPADRDRLLHYVRRWLIVLIFFSVLIVLAGIGCSVLLFLGGSSYGIIDQVAGGIQIVLVVVLLVLLIIIGVYFDKAKDKIEQGLQRPTVTEKFERKAEIRNQQVQAAFQDRQQMRNEELTEPSLTTYQPYVPTNTESQQGVNQFLQNSHARYLAERAKKVVK